MSPTRTESRPGRAGVEPPPAGRPVGAAAGQPPMDPRFAQRRDELARHRWRRRTRLLLAVLAAACLVVAGWFLLHTPLFAARSVTVVGSTRTPPAEIVAAAGLARRPPLIAVDPAAAAAAVERLPWVATATVSRRWPDAVTVTVHQRVPVAAVPRPVAPGSAPGWDVVDRTGRVLEVVPAPPAGLVHLAAPGSLTGPGGSLAPGARVGLAVASSLPVAFAAQVAAVTAEPGGQVALTLTTPVTVQLGTPVQLPAKYEDVAAMLAGATLHTGDVIDVSVPGSPTVISR